MKRLTSIFLQTKVLCNASCVICPYKDTYRGSGIEGKEMSPEMYCVILDDLGRSYSGEIGLYFHYEPLTDPRLPWLISLAKRKCPQSNVTISTNASLLTRDMAIELVSSGLDTVYFHMLGGKQETFERFEPPLKWHNVLGNVHFFASVFKGKMYANYIQTRENASELGLLGKAIPSNIQVINCFWASNRGGNATVNVPDGARTRFARGSDGLCSAVRNCLYVYYDGVVPLCCQCWNREVTIGNVIENPIGELFAMNSRHCGHDICEECK